MKADYPDMISLEAQLASLTGRRHCVISGRATSALYAIFRALPKRSGRIVFPSILCPSPAWAAQYAGFEPIFCDVEAADANLSPRSLERLLNKYDDIAAIVVAHLYGQPADLSAISNVAARHRVPLIEDAAQAFGATVEGRPAGSHGLASVLSFGHTKIVDAGGGGALLTDDDDLAARSREILAELPAAGENFAALGTAYRSDYYHLKTQADADPVAHGAFLAIPDRYKKLFLVRATAAQADAISKALPTLEVTVRERRHKAAIYHEVFAADSITALRGRVGGVPWRYNICLPAGTQKRVTDDLRAAGFDASNWYPSLHRWFESGRGQDDSELSTALDIESRVLNLWLDDATDNARVRACANHAARLARGAAKLPDACHS